MNLTDRTIEDILVELVGKGEMVRLIIFCIVALILGILTGWFFTQLYYNKFKYIQLKNKVNEAEQSKKQAENRLSELNEEYTELEEKYKGLKHLRDRYYASFATKPDEPDPVLYNIFKE